MNACLRTFRAPRDLAIRMATSATQPMAANVNRATSNSTGMLVLRFWMPVFEPAGVLPLHNGCQSRAFALQAFPLP